MHPGSIQNSHVPSTRVKLDTQSGQKQKLFSVFENEMM